MDTKIAGRRTKWIVRYGLALLAMVGLVVISSIAISMRWHRSSDLFVDREFSIDHTFADREIGVAFRLPKSGIFGKGRYYVVVIRDKEGRLLETLYEGPGGYPDVPPRPTFVASDGAQATYEIPESGPKTFRLDRRSY